MKYFRQDTTTVTSHCALFVLACHISLASHDEGKCWVSFATSLFFFLVLLRNSLSLPNHLQQKNPFFSLLLLLVGVVAWWRGDSVLSIDRESDPLGVLCFRKVNAGHIKKAKKKKKKRVEKKIKGFVSIYYHENVAEVNWKWNMIAIWHECV